MIPEVVTYIIAVSLSTIIPPFVAVPLQLTAAQRYGLELAFIYTITGNLIGGMVAFAIGRRYGWRLVKKLFGVEKTEKAKKYASRYGFWHITIGRMALSNLWDALSYASGLTKMTYSQYFLSTLISVLPSTTLIILFGNTIDLDFALTVWLSIGIFAISIYIVTKQLMKNKNG